jgi:hypothetical protein
MFLGGINKFSGHPMQCGAKSSSAPVPGPVCPPAGTSLVLFLLFDVTFFIYLKTTFLVTFYAISIVFRMKLKAVPVVK